ICKIFIWSHPTLQGRAQNILVAIFRQGRSACVHVQFLENQEWEVGVARRPAFANSDSGAVAGNNPPIHLQLPAVGGADSESISPRQFFATLSGGENSLDPTSIYRKRS